MWNSFKTALLSPYFIGPGDRNNFWGHQGRRRVLGLGDSPNLRPSILLLYKVPYLIQDWT